ncbi:HAD hydrolase-like protein [Enterovibrio coralii]|uniref:HAD hydrolase-like protein n=1 Tax=Enterovibrio coralii TaxID=294935 RepID=UPI001E61FD56|nr:HAD hydrolase-like protein [Enterovibrio coralii]
MFFSARDYLKIDMEQSVMIGDKADDMRAADAAGIPTKVLVRTGKDVTADGEALATTVLNSIADVPAFLKSL